MKAMVLLALGGGGFLGCAADAGDPRRCIAPPGVDASPETIEAALEFLNSLPEPVDLPCILEALERPLEVQASDSVFSAQPADGRRSPRVFIFYGDLTLSVVIDGEAARLLEFAQRLNGGLNLQSIKGEVEVPAQVPLSQSAPYEHVLRGTLPTTCGFCHANEELQREIDGVPVFASFPLKPRDADLVDLEELRQEWTMCDASAEPERCAALSAMFEHGPVVHRPFPDEYDVFF